MPAAAPPSHTAPHVMQCMEVWGGNRAINTSVTLAGLDTWVYARPYATMPNAATSVEPTAEPTALPSPATDQGGGDIHYLSSCMSGRISRMLVADVAGHGAAVDQVAVTLRDLMRRYVNFLDQSRFVQSLNVQFGSGAKAGSFATALVATYWVPTSSLVATNAGHPPPLIRRAADGRWGYLTASHPDAAGHAAPANLPLGILEPTTYDQFTVTLREGDLVLIYTDSLLETRDRRGNLLGQDGLLRIIQEQDAGEPGDIIPSILAALATEQGSDSFTDDVTCLLIRRNAVRPKSGLGYLVNAAGVITAQMLAAIRGRHSPVAMPELSWRTIRAALRGMAFPERRAGRSSR